MSRKTLLLIPALALLATQPCQADMKSFGEKERWHKVSGTAIHYFDDMAGRNPIVHSETATGTGARLRSTETIDLSGDLEGRVLYQPQTVIEFAECSLVNTGNQVFSGMIEGIGPVLLHDDLFRFEVNTCTGETVGKVYLINSIDGPRVDCLIDIIGTGMSEEGNGLAEYTGQCRLRAARGRKLK